MGTTFEQDPTLQRPIGPELDGPAGVEVLTVEVTGADRFTVFAEADYFRGITRAIPRSRKTSRFACTCDPLAHESPAGQTGSGARPPKGWSRGWVLT